MQAMQTSRNSVSINNKVRDVNATCLLTNNVIKNCANIEKINLAVRNFNSTSDEGVTETQHATCKITTEELVASARASVTRVLTGTCNASKK